MPIELSYLSASILLFILQVAVQGIFSNMEHSPKELLGARDGLVDRSAYTQRSKRAVYNSVEALLMFVPLVLIAAHLDRFNEVTAWGAALFFWGRLAYAVLYVLGTPVLRSVVWTVAVIGIVLVLSQVLPFS
jgi:uncharacterized MAPEG superfamily protein